MLSPRDPFPDAYLPIVSKFQMDVQDGAFSGTPECSPSLHVAKSAVKVLRDIIGRVRQDEPQAAVLTLLRSAGKALAATEPYGALIANVVRRVLWIVRGEQQRFLEENADYAEKLRKTPKAASIVPPANAPFSALDAHIQLSPPTSHLGVISEMAAETRWGPIKGEVLACIAEYLDELSVTKAALCKQAEKHVRDGETVLTYGHSKTIESFLLAAAIQRRFRVIVVDSCPDTQGTTMAAALGAHGVDVTVVPLSSVFAVIGDVGKVILGTQLVLANGGSMAQAGSQIIALCAREHNVPVLVIAATEKFSPYHPVDRICSAVVKCADNTEHIWDNEGNPERVLPLSAIPPEAVDRVDVIHVITDYVHPDLVTLYITNEDSFGPNYAYRLIAELYCPEDFDV